MDSSKQTNKPAQMTLDELFRKTFSSLLASLIDTLNIFEEKNPPNEPHKDS